MNNTIFRRKFVLGVLIAFVLGFGVQGVAEAVLTASKVSGDHQDKLFNQDFTFSFRISGVDTTDADDESITITVAPATVSLRVGSESATAATFTLNENAPSPNVVDDNIGRLSNGTISVRCSPTVPGSFTVTVTDQASPAGFTPLIFTGYGIRRPEDIADQTFSATDGTTDPVTNPKIGIGLANPQNNYDLDSDVMVTLTGTGTNSTWVYVNFSVDGPGRLYEDRDGDMSPDANALRSTLTTFSNDSNVASAKLRMNGGTNKVTASIKDATDETHVITYFYQGILLNKVSGDGQVGRPSALLPNPIVVEVRDAGPSRSPVSGQEVVFSISTGGTLASASGFPSEIDANNNYTVSTDSNGQAKIRTVLPATEGLATVTAVINANNNDDFTDDTYRVTFTFTSDANAAEIVTPIIQPQPTESLTVSAPASATGGTTIDVTATTSDSRGSQLVAFTSNRGGTFATASVPTGSDGVARMRFTLPRTGGALTITASATDYRSGTATVQVTSALPLLTVENRPVGGVFSATAGTPLNIIIGTGTVSGITVTLTGPSGSNISPAVGVTVSGPSGATATIPVTLPNTGSFLLTASAPNYQSTSISVFVSGSTTPTTEVPVRLMIPSGTNRVQTVTIGSSATLRVRVTRTDTNAAQSGVEVTFRDSSGNDLPSGTVNTDGNGDATYQFSVISTARRLISAVITDSDVDASGATPVTFEITGTAQQPTTSTRLTIIQPVDSLGQTVITGGPGVAYPLTILFNNENNTPAVNQVVTITVRNAAQVVQSSTVLITDNTGRAVTPDTFRLPKAAGAYTITAVSGTQTRAVTVTVFAVSLVKDTSDSVSGDNQDGNRGEVLDEPFVVKVVRVSDSTAVQGVPVTFTVTDGDGELSESSTATGGSRTLTVDSDANGDVRAYLVLDEDDEDNEVTASVGITGVADVTFEATGSLVPDSLEIVSGDNQRIAVNQRSAPMIVHVTDEDGDDLEGVTVSFSMRGGSGTLTPRSAETDRLGEAEAELLPRAAGTYFITARVSGVSSVTFTINVGNLADDIEIVSGNNQSGDPGTELDDPFVVEVLDEDGDTVSGVTVTFSVTDGGGSLSATSDTTDSRGRAETYLTLGDEPGRNTVRASVSGVSTRVTFTATAIDPAPPEPDIRLPASRRADTYWINTDGGTLHRLVGNNVEDIASSVENVVSLVVTSNRLYWVEKTGNNSGRIRRSNLNGSNIQLIRDLSAAPAGITVDTASNTIYLTNERGKVQSINIDGSGFVPNLVLGLTDPTDIAVDSGKVYWITGDGTVQSADVDGSGVSTISSGYDMLNSIAVGGGKVYWTEQTGDDSGKIHSANLNGTNVEELRTTRGVPYGISYDGDDDKIYWADSLGRIMQGNRDASTIRAVVSDLVSLGDVAVPSGTTTRAPGTFSKYDVNRDGVVDNIDASLVANALGESPPSDPRLDVNDDGVVNFLDLLLVFDNRDESNAAPVAVAKERPKVSREEVQRQIALLLATDNQSATAQFTLAYLQSLLEVVTPEKTRLLANYPNPFNPETWIPYQLATSSDVQITIYNSAGREVRTLSLGHQSKGYYTDRSRAAYWDGRNAIGEHVASGVYFYTLITDRMSATRKMLILK
ncbi:T9SS type A sorting domain-containing protein [Candidatus Poribacteria bacterium]|nr:T9SS type A sorting domain-containing protein [Candidatus Poribacteria bacterium]